MINENVQNEINDGCTRKSQYGSPRLMRYGEVRDLTQTGTGKSSESKAGGNQNCDPDPLKKPCSERRVKENIVLIGDHPLGIGLYLFDYKPEYRGLSGHGRQFGVMIDEVETVMPDAVCVNPEGFKVVDYAMLGIERTVH